MSAPSGANTRYYRLLLASYPRHWRRSLRTEEILGVLLDAADAEGRSGPTAAEALNLIQNGLAARLHTAVSVSELVRDRIAHVALATGAALSMTLLVLGELGIPAFGNLLPGLDTARTADNAGDLLPSRFGPFQSLGILSYAGWLLMLASTMAGRIRITRQLGAATLGVTMLLSRIGRITHHQRPPYSLLVGLALLAAAVLLMPDRASRIARFTVPAGAIAGGLALIGWRVWALSGLPADSPLRARSCFYWCPRGQAEAVPRPDGSTRLAAFGGADTIAQYVLPAVAVAALLALLGWHWDRTWLAAVAVISLPCLAIGWRDADWAWLPYYSKVLAMPSPRLSLILGGWALVAAAAIALASQQERQPGGIRRSAQAATAYE